MPLCLTFIELKKAFDKVAIETAMEALYNQGFPTPYIKILRELYSNFTTKIPPFYNVIIDVKRGVSQGDTISPKIASATFKNAMRRLKWDIMGVKVDSRHLHHFRFADNIVLITSSIIQTRRYADDAPVTLNRTNISECSNYVYLSWEINITNNLKSELGRRKRAAWEAFKSKDVVKRINNIQLLAHLFNTTVLPSLAYASETSAFRKQEENAIDCGIERVMLGVTRFTQVKQGIRTSLLSHRSKIRDAATYAKESKITMRNFAFLGICGSVSDHKLRRPNARFVSTTITG
ncbi:hypothetical protein RB195_021440 [Necator americanus]|uniref:Reverse transcriptase domain-containing protein n=1 Tax=Necator americanus TaxID=51031 RepID=A0ABR1EC36_NECAM